MKSSRARFAATFMAASLWLPAEARVPAQAPAALPDAAKARQAEPVAKRERSGPPFGVVRDKQQEIPNDLAIADGLGIKPVQIKGPDSIEKVAPGGRAFKWVLTPPPELELWAVPILDLRRTPAASTPVKAGGTPGTVRDGGTPISDNDVIKEDIIKHDLVTRGRPVQTAGVALLQDGTLLIDPRSGHYQASEESVKLWGKPAFELAGFKVKFCKQILPDH